MASGTTTGDGRGTTAGAVIGGPAGMVAGAMPAAAGWRQRPRCDATAAWQRLTAHHAPLTHGGPAFDLRRAFEADAGRFERFSQRAPHVLADFSRQWIDAPTEALLLDLARECGVEAHRDAMLALEAINTTENRPVEHVFYRDPRVKSSDDAIKNVATRIRAERAAMLAFAQRVRDGGQIDDVIHLGVGGSALGPQLVVQALAATGACDGPRVHFVRNVDGHALAPLLQRCDPARTLVLVASKSFGTLETMHNAETARDWLQRAGMGAGRLVALTAEPARAQDWGAGEVLTFGEAVGGRYSLWSCIGLPIALAAGPAAFEALLAGAAEMDAHFMQAPLAANLPVRLALIDIWYRNFHHLNSRAVVPYHEGLALLPAWLQQLEMESNGKSVDAEGRPVPYATAPVIWGGVGTDVQHSFFQYLHQGSEPVPLEILAVREAAHPFADHHQGLLAAALGQARSLMLGRDDEVGHQRFPGNKPCGVLLLERLDARALGALLALYEHRCFVAGSIWGVNSFDQWGVELGKQFARDLTPRLTPGARRGDAAGLDAATAGLLAWLTGRADDGPGDGAPRR